MAVVLDSVLGVGLQLKRIRARESEAKGAVEPEATGAHIPYDASARPTVMPFEQTWDCQILMNGQQ